MNPAESAIAIADTLRAAAANKIAASIAAEAVEDDDVPDGYSMTFAVTIDGLTAHYDDLAAAADGLSNYFAEYVALRTDQP